MLHLCAPVLNGTEEEAHDERKESEKNVQGRERDGEKEKARLLVRGPIVEDFSRKELSVRGSSRREACAPIEREVFRFDVEDDRDRDG